jgi:hypothetical protein
MISSKFKKTVVKHLKTDYDIDCYRVSMCYDEAKRSQNFTLFCSYNRKMFELTLAVNLCTVDSLSHCYSFTVFAKADCIDCLPQLTSSINPDIIVDSIQEVREVLSYINHDYSFKMDHRMVILISGTYLVGSSYFEIKTIKSSVETISFIKLHDFFDKGTECAYLNIVGNTVVVQPSTSCSDINQFKQQSVIEVGGMTTFKKNLAKCIIFHLNKHHKTSDYYNDDEADYMPLNYDDLKRYLLVHSMVNI